MNYTDMSPETAQAFDYFAGVEAQEEAEELKTEISRLSQLSKLILFINQFKYMHQLTMFCRLFDSVKDIAHYNYKFKNNSVYGSFDDFKSDILQTINACIRNEKDAQDYKYFILEIKKINKICKLLNININKIYTIGQCDFLKELNKQLDQMILNIEYLSIKSVTTKTTNTKKSKSL